MIDHRFLHDLRPASTAAVMAERALPRLLALGENCYISRHEPYRCRSRKAGRPPAVSRAATAGRSTRSSAMPALRPASKSATAASRSRQSSPAASPTLPTPGARCYTPAHCCSAITAPATGAATNTSGVTAASRCSSHQAISARSRQVSPAHRASASLGRCCRPPAPFSPHGHARG